MSSLMVDGGWRSDVRTRDILCTYRLRTVGRITSSRTYVVRVCHSRVEDQSLFKFRHGTLRSQSHFTLLHFHYG
jgi:hypothetical protein